ncbi:hypothetical protein, partial [Rhodococcus koreensis]|uniref:hypothetical protein n=1 Tax=Rhodococcus koreensis TaxID=99653 RepID=UPI0036708728
VHNCFIHAKLKLTLYTGINFSFIWGWGYLLRPPPPFFRRSHPRPPAQKLHLLGKTVALG